MPIPSAGPARTATARDRTLFRVVALAEAVSWLGLLVGMYLKWIRESTEAGVKIFGPVHGTIFVAYVLTCLWSARRFAWSPKVLLAALACAVPPFATAAFEAWADRRGLLRPAGAPTAAGADGPRLPH